MIVEIVDCLTSSSFDPDDGFRKALSHFQSVPVTVVITAQIAYLLWDITLVLRSQENIAAKKKFADEINNNEDKKYRYTRVITRVLIDSPSTLYSSICAKT